MDAGEPRGLDPRRVRIRFDRAATTYEAAALIPMEVGERLIDHLEPLVVNPARVLDLGAGTGAFSRRLAKRFTGARVFELDFARSMLLHSRRGWRWGSRRFQVCGDAQLLPFHDQSFDIVFSNATLEWCNDLARTVGEIARVLQPGGLILFSTFGPDTLETLRRSWASCDAEVHVHTFMDMHDLGDALTRAGISGVVMETERLTVEFPNLDTMVADLRAMGATNAARQRRTSLIGRERLTALRRAFETHRRGDIFPETFEVVYGHGWRLAPGRVEVALDASPPR